MPALGQLLFALCDKETAEADEELGRRVMSDEIQLHIESIARHLRGLGLTEQQIELHLAPLKTRHVGPNPSRRKIGRDSIIESHFIPRSRKGASLA
jgi:hypothetical protein